MIQFSKKIQILCTSNSLHCKKKSPEPGWDWVKPKRIGPRAVARPGNLVFIIQKPGLGYLEGAPGLKSDFPVVLHGKSDSQTRKHRTLFIPEANVPAHNIFLSRPENLVGSRKNRPG